MTTSFKDYCAERDEASIIAIRREYRCYLPRSRAMKAIILSAFGVWVLIFGAGLSSAAPLETAVAPRSGSMDDTFTLEVTARGPITAERPGVPDSDDFSVQYLGPQSITEIFNGSVDQRTIFVFQLIPKREGALQTPAIAIEVAGQPIISEKVTISVSKDAAEAAPDPDLILRQSVSPLTAFVGQQLNYQLEFMTAVPVSETTLPDLTIESFRSEQLGEDTQSVKYERNREYRTISIRRALFPLTPGSMVIPERSLRLKKLQPPSLSRFPFGGLSPFDAPFSGGTRATSVTVRAAAIPLTILPLPPAPPKLVGWNGALPLVGATSISVTYDESPIEQGTSKTITVSVITEGSGASIKKGLLSPQPSFRVYEEPGATQTSAQQGKLVTQRTVRLTVVPLTAGTMELGALALSYFDPGTQSYQTATSRTITFQVIPPAGTTPVALPSPTSSTTNPTITDQSRHEPDLVEESLSAQLIRRVGLPLLAFGMVSFVGLAAVCLLWITRLRRLRSRGPERFTKRLREASDINLLNHVLETILCELLSPGAPPVGGEGLKALVRRTIQDGGLQFDVLTFLNHLEATRFAPPTYGPIDHTALVKTSSLLIERIASYLVTPRR